MAEEKMQQAIDNPSSSGLSTRMANLFLSSISLIEEKVAAGNAEIALGYIEAFYMYQVFDQEMSEEHVPKNHQTDRTKAQTELHQFEWTKEFLQEFNVLSTRPELGYSE